MPTYLMTWNPNRWNWEDIAEASELTGSGQVYESRWSSGNTRTIKRGERVFLLKQGAEPRGIVASGWTSSDSDSYEADHWDESGAKSFYVDIDFDRILKPDVEPPLATSQFTTGPLSTVYWGIPASGTQLPEDAAAELETRWEEYLRSLADKPKAPRNPPWVRDELILALDLYVRHGGKPLAPSHPEVVDLRNLLNSLPIHSYRGNVETFRNENGVSMKLMNFRRFDPNFQGVGMTRGNKLEKEVWDQYAGRPALLRQIAESIRTGYQVLEEDTEYDPDEESFAEGRVLYRLHRMRERNKGVIQKAKAIAKRKHGRLFCAVCKFDFARTYGELGEDFIEGHHAKPISELAADSQTKPTDIVLLCANCHRMVHRRRPWLSVEDLGTLLATM